MLAGSLVVPLNVSRTPGIASSTTLVADSRSVTSPSSRYFALRPATSFVGAPSWAPVAPNVTAAPVARDERTSLSPPTTAA